MIRFGEKNYELKYNLKRIEMIEAQTSLPTMAQIKTTSGYFGITDLKSYLTYGLKEEGADVFLMPVKAQELADEMIIDVGYTQLCSEVLTALERDCPFFFRGA